MDISVHCALDCILVCRAAQLRDHWGYGMFESQIGSLKKGWADFFGDQADDYKNIKRGYYLYHLGYFGG